MASRIASSFLLAASALTSVIASPIASREADASKFRYLTNKTAPYQVKSLPDVPYDLGEFYSGNVDINKGIDGYNLFFAFKPAINAPSNTLTIWLNGGPGCSSLEGFFEENGPWVWTPGTKGPTYNPYNWANLTNMLWVEQPVSTGFSQGISTANTEEEIAADFVKWFKNWEQLFGIQNYQIYVTGESYAGRYIPYISAAMLDQKDKKYYNVSGAIIYDPVIGDITVQQETGIMPIVDANEGSFGFNQSVQDTLHKKEAQCGWKQWREKYLTYPPPGPQPDASLIRCSVFDPAINYAEYNNPCFDIYEITQQCPTPYDPLGFNGESPYFDRADVKKAMHAPSNVKWSECGGNVFPIGDLSQDSIRKVLPQVIEATNRVLVANGDIDAILTTAGTLLAIQNMTWNGKLGLQTKPTKSVDVSKANGFPVTDAGIQLFDRGLMWTETFQSGHMEPEFQPAVAFRHLQWMLGLTNSL